MLKNCECFKLFVILDAANITMARGERFISELTQVIRIFSEKGLQAENLKKSIQPFFVRFGEYKTNEHFTNKLDQIKDFFV